MALRLVQSQAPAVAAPVATPSEVVASLHSRADALLRARDTTGWKALVAGTADLESPHTRWAARRVLLESVLAKRDLPAPALAESFHAAAVAAVELLEQGPAEPMLLNLAGVLSYELGTIAAAESLFRAAERLDPELPHVEANLRACKERRKQGSGPLRGMPPHILRALRTFGPRAQAVAARAVPATGLTLSLCMIVRDEEAMLPRCLAAVRDHVDELIVVDTGSTDRTVEIAESFGAKVLHHTWTGDFGAARNVSFDAATGDWLMFLDADEVLVEGDGPRLRALTGHTWREAFFLIEQNHTGDLEDGTSVTHNALRMFRNRPQYRFQGRIHEQIAHALPDLPERLESSTVRVEHFGYLGVVRDAKEKSRRNIELLEKQVADGIDSPFLHFNLGSELSAAGEPLRALESLERAWTMLSDDPQRRRYGYFPSLCTRYVKALHHGDRAQDAVDVAEEVLSLVPGHTDVVLEQGLALAKLGRSEEALERLRRCEEMGDAPPRCSGSVGAGTFLALVARAHVHEQRGEHEEAISCLERSLAEHPGYAGAIDSYARLRLTAQRADPAEVVAAVHGHVSGEDGLLSSSARFLLAVPLYEAGAVVEAEAELRELLELRPGVHPARLALAEALLSQGRMEEAGAVAAGIPADAPCAAGAARTRLFAALAAPQRDPAVVADAFRAAGEAVVPAPEVAVFAAWRDGADPAARPLPAATAPLLATLLEALARIECFDAFADLAQVAERVDLPWRARRELLAGVYLRRGFLESAADEWIEVVEREGADVPALMGLAEVARLRGMDEDAALLRAEADQIAAAA